jgi:hypothetical protein
MMNIKDEQSVEETPTIEQLEQRLSEKVQQDGALRRFLERQQRLAAFMPPVAHIRRSSGRSWLPL